MEQKKELVFVSGNFNVLHAGHIRLFAFARNFGDELIVGVNSDRIAGDAAYIQEALRLEAVQTNSWVDRVVLIDEPIDDLVERLKPAVVVKGREFEHLENVEEEALSYYGGRLIFGTSELPISSRNILAGELASSNYKMAAIPPSYIKQHDINLEMLQKIINEFNSLRVAVLGDLIVDEYISCEGLGMSQEDTSLVVTPVDKRRFLGGAGIVAAHASQLGASSSLITILGNDECGEFARQTLSKYRVEEISIVDDSRPTTLKQRFRSGSKTLLRVSHLIQSSVSPNLQDRIYEKFVATLDQCDLVVFSDFNYGCLPQQLVEKCISAAAARNVMCVADSQSSSQVGDVSRFHNMTLISATEREARIALRDHDDGLAVIADKLRNAAKAQNILLKLGEDGVLLHMRSDSRGVLTNELPALNPRPVDVAGAGDSMLIASGLALAVGATPWAAAVLGTYSAAIQIGRLGNKPLSQSELVAAIQANFS